MGNKQILCVEKVRSIRKLSFYDFNLTGTKWPLSHHDLMPCDSLTVSNQFEAEEVKIDFGNGRIVIMETRD